MLKQAGVNVGLTHNLALGVVGRGLGPEGDLRDIRLGVEREHPEQARRLPDANDHHARGERIECARMPHAALPQRPAHTGHDVVGCAPNGLIDRDETIQL